MLTELVWFMKEVHFADADALAVLRSEVEMAGLTDGLSVGEKRFLSAAESFVLDAIRGKRDGDERDLPN